MRLCCSYLLKRFNGTNSTMFPVTVTPANADNLLTAAVHGAPAISNRWWLFPKTSTPTPGCKKFLFLTNQLLLFRQAAENAAKMLHFHLKRASCKQDIGFELGCKFSSDKKKCDVIIACSTFLSDHKICRKVQLFNWIKSNWSYQLLFICYCFFLYF